MAQVSKKRATYEDLLAVPATRVAEILFGVLYTQARPGTPHARASSALGGELSGPFDRGRGGPGGWIILDEPELHLGEDVVVPDLAAWTRARMPELPHAPAIELAPDWICEVISPSTEAIDRSDKLQIYAREHVTHAWLIDPLAKTLELFWLDGSTYRLMHVFRGDARVRAEPFSAIELELDVLWSR